MAREGTRSNAGGLLLAWLGAAIGAVLLVRLLLQALRALRHGSGGAYEFAGGAASGGFVPSVVDVVIAVLALTAAAWSLRRRGRQGDVRRRAR